MTAINFPANTIDVGAENELAYEDGISDSRNFNGCAGLFASKLAPTGR